MYFLCHHIRVAKINTCTCIKQEDNKNIFSYRDKFFNSEEKKSNSFNYCKTLKKVLINLFCVQIHLLLTFLKKHIFRIRPSIDFIIGEFSSINQSINFIHQKIASWRHNDTFLLSLWAAHLCRAAPLRDDTTRGGVLSIPIRLSA